MFKENNNIQMKNDNFSSFYVNREIQLTETFQLFEIYHRKKNYWINSYFDTEYGPFAFDNNNIFLSPNVNVIIGNHATHFFLSFLTTENVDKSASSSSSTNGPLAIAILKKMPIINPYQNPWYCCIYQNRSMFLQMYRVCQPVIWTVFVKKITWIGVIVHPS